LQFFHPIFFDHWLRHDRNDCDDAGREWHRVLLDRRDLQSKRRDQQFEYNRELGQQQHEQLRFDGPFRHRLDVRHLRQRLFHEQWLNAAVIELCFAELVAE